jgi:hypothetical protein
VSDDRCERHARDNASCGRAIFNNLGTFSEPHSNAAEAQDCCRWHPRETRRGEGASKLRWPLRSRVWVPGTLWLDSVAHACTFDRVPGTVLGVATVFSSQRFTGCLASARSSIEHPGGWAVERPATVGWTVQHPASSIRVGGRPSIQRPATGGKVGSSLLTGHGRPTDYTDDSFCVDLYQSVSSVGGLGWAGGPASSIQHPASGWAGGRSSDQRPATSDGWAGDEKKGPPSGDPLIRVCAGS